MIKNQKQEYLDMGFKMMPSGRINHHLWYGRKYGLSSTKDTTWKKTLEKKVGIYSKGYHSCCMSKKPYCHNVGCINRREVLGEDDYSDLKPIKKCQNQTPTYKK